MFLRRSHNFEKKTQKDCFQAFFRELAPGRILNDKQLALNLNIYFI